MTMVMKMVSKSQFKAQLLAYLRKIEQEKKPLLITHGGKPVIKVSPYQEEPDKILKSLKNSIISYEDPFDPIGQDQWEVLQ